MYCFFSVFETLSAKKSPLGRKFTLKDRTNVAWNLLRAARIAWGFQYNHGNELRAADVQSFALFL